ncbi:MAG TPA: hypothetical protein ENJ18_14665 [Nannocystis exedens]|nr:hypothetical protein [Nannocystis exedens]
MTLTLNTSAKAASAAPVDEPEPELVPDSEPNSDPELGSVLSPLAASDEAPDEFDEFDEFEAPLAKPSLLGVVVVTGSFREQPENPAKAIKVSESGTHNASARPTAEIRDVETIT